MNITQNLVLVLHIKTARCSYSEFVFYCASKITNCLKITINYSSHEVKWNIICTGHENW